MIENTLIALGNIRDNSEHVSFLLKSHNQSMNILVLSEVVKGES